MAEFAARLRDICNQHQLKINIKIYMDEQRDQAVERTWQRYSGEIGGTDEKPKRIQRLVDNDQLQVVEDEPADDVHNVARNRRLGSL